MRIKLRVELIRFSSPQPEYLYLLNKPPESSSHNYVELSISHSFGFIDYVYYAPKAETDFHFS